MKLAKKLCSLLLAVMMVIAICSMQTLGVSLDSGTENILRDFLYQKQYVNCNQKKGSGDCVVCSIAMLLRRAAIINGTSRDIWGVYDQNSVIQKNGGSNSVGPFSDTIDGHTYTLAWKGRDSCINPGVQKYGSQKKWLIAFLKEHPEGIVIYGRKGTTESWHAAIVTHYDETEDTFYCMDPANNYNSLGTGMVPLKDTVVGRSYLGGSTQDSMINSKNLVTVWYVQSGINYHAHDWSNTGLCGCGAKYGDWVRNQGTNLYQRVKGTLTPASGSAIYIKQQPYKEPAGQYLAKVTSCEAVALLTNTIGNKWYEVTYTENGTAKTGYVYSGDVSFTKAPNNLEVKCSLASKFGGQITEGTSLWAKNGDYSGSVSSSDGVTNLTKVVFGIYNYSTGAATSSKNVVTKTNIGSPKYSITNADDTILFSSLSPGHYTFRIDGYADGTASSSASFDFYVVAKGSTTVLVTGVSLNKTSLDLNVGETGTLSATVSPSNATNKNVTWSSSNTAVASVSGGTVTAVGAGQATITVKTADGGKTAACTVTVTAPKTYAVRYDANGGTGAPDGQTGTAGSKLTLSTTIPTRTNAKFMSWQDQNGDTHQPGTEITVESNLTLEAIWALKFVEDGQYVQLDESSYAAPGCIVNVPVLIKNFGNPTSVDLNATFIGHKDIGNHELSTEGAPEYVGYTPSSAIELREDGLLCVGTAQFKIPGSATLGERFFILITDVDLTITDQYGELQVIQNGINVWDGSEAESNSLYRVYANTVPTYTIAYIANGGTGEPNDQTKSQGESVCLSTQIPTKEGYLFKGWIIRGILYAPGDEYTEDSDAWAFAVWEEKTSDSYTVSFNANGGSGTMNSVTGISGDYTLPANGFIAPEGKQFKGWATSPSGAVITGTSYNVTANTTFYAVWEEIPTSDSTTLQIGKAVSVRGKEVVIPISLTNNTGIASMNFKIEYDKTRLQLTGFGDAQMAGWMVGVGTGEKAIWVDENGSSANGDILLLRFMVLDTAEDGLAEITVTGLDVVDIDEKDVPVTVVSGGIEVISRIPGDSNDDGNVSAADVLRLKKYLAGMEVEINPSNTDVTGDGRVSAADLLRLKKYFAGMDVVLE